MGNKILLKPPILHKWQRQIAKTLLPYIGVTALVAVLCWADHELYWGVFQLEWLSVSYVLAIACVRGAQSVKRQCATPRIRQCIITGVLVLALISMPLGFWLFHPTFTVKQAKEQLLQSETIEAISFSEDNTTIPTETALGKFIQSGYVFSATKKDGSEATLFFDPVSGNWSWLTG